MMKFDIALTVSIKQDKLEDLILSAIEGGSNYWYFIEENANDQPYEKSPFVAGSNGLRISNRILSDNGECDYLDAWLNVESVKNGLRVMSNKYTRHLINLIEGNDDAATADVFLQCCLFGSVVYG